VHWRLVRSTERRREDGVSKRLDVARLRGSLHRDGLAFATPCTGFADMERQTNLAILYVSENIRVRRQERRRAPYLAYLPAATVRRVSDL